MSQSSLWIMKAHKRAVASRRYNKRNNINQPPSKEDEASPSLAHMSKEETKLMNYVN